MSTSTNNKITSASSEIKDTEQAISLPEIVSALLDDETGTFEQRRVLDELKAEDSVRDELHTKLSTYALIGETLRSGKPAAVVSSDFLSGIHDELESEPEYSSHTLENHLKSEKPNEKGSWLRPVGGFAMAASVAALAVIGFQNYFGKTDNGFLDTSGTEVLAINTQQNGSTLAKKSKLTQAEMDSAVIVSADSLQTKMRVETKLKSPTLAMPESNSNSTDTTYQQADAKTRSLLKSYVDSHMQYASTTAFVPSIRVIAYSDY